MCVDQLSDGDLIAEKVKCLLQAVEIVRADEYSGRTAVASYDDAFVLTLHAVNELRESIFDVPQRISCHGYNCATTTTRTATVR